jgi:FtsP/CotA-like multicopper oxidase with cupredoxin domain
MAYKSTWEQQMPTGFKCFVTIVFAGVFISNALAQCPLRPPPGAVLQDTASLYSQNGVLNAALTMGQSVDIYGYTHYCYKYKSTAGSEIEAPTLRLNPGDHLSLHVTDSIATSAPQSVSSLMANMDMSGPAGATCGDTGTATVSSTNVHFHGLNIPPVCHQDDVLTTLIQPGTSGFQYDTQIPLTEPPGLYWYHPHVHGFTEFQVNGGAAGALIVEGMEKYRPEVAGLVERVFVVRQQYLVPWVPGPYELSMNFEVADNLPGPAPIIQMKSGEKQFWRVANATLQDFMPLQFWFNGVPQKLQLIALDGYPLAETRTTDTITIPPAGRAEFIVQAPTDSSTVAQFMVLNYNTGPTGNADLQQPLGTIQLSTPKAATSAPSVAAASSSASTANLKFAGLSAAAPTTTRKLFFSEEFGGTNGPIQFYITVDGQKQKVFNPNEAPAITTHVGAVEDWTIENRALETHAFHIHQIHFLLLEQNGKPVANQDMRDTIEIPYWTGTGPYPSVKVRMDFRDPTIAGTFVFHCHILLHEDLGMMHKIQVLP